MANIGGQKIFMPKPPDRGSFPLDHESECKTSMISYLKCLNDNNSDNTSCRLLAKDYLKCRMDRQLMAKEDFKVLGFKDQTDATLDHK
ncbi:unnamed protein product [Medioppia subpectinata]|uniref:Cytochrome c oxidase assembly protein COX19 n=1 Tax=Medioppia subpectinata TaxID=1979941 RepID=A0A7R9KBH7_9ACAR|nr:unnamed protein product [Medioppia subpectinata]CAG2100249.1 unnamed protein product [Medioppia subpectinata]